MLLIHLLVNSGSVECTFCDLFCVYSEIMFNIISLFQKLIKGGLEQKRGGGGGLDNVSKINERGNNHSVLESKNTTAFLLSTKVHFISLRTVFYIANLRGPEIFGESVRISNSV